MSRNEHRRCDANAQFNAGSGNGGDVVVASTAIGNRHRMSARGVACGAAATGQTNGGNMLTGSISVNGAGAIYGSASAIGNSATLSHPSGN
jgi:hypothetical protein